MTFDRLDALEKQWKLRPPVHWLIAHFLGYEPPAEKQYMDADAAKEFMKRTGGKIGGVARQ